MYEPSYGHKRYFNGTLIFHDVVAKMSKTKFFNDTIVNPILVITVYSFLIFQGGRCVEIIDITVKKTSRKHILYGTERQPKEVDYSPSDHCGGKLQNAEINCPGVHTNSFKLDNMVAYLIDCIRQYGGFLIDDHLT